VKLSFIFPDSGPDKSNATNSVTQILISI